MCALKVCQKTGHRLGNLTINNKQQPRPMVEPKGIPNDVPGAANSRWFIVSKARHMPNPHNTSHFLYSTPPLGCAQGIQ